MTPNRAPSTIWGLRDLATYPNGYVRTVDDEAIEVVWYDRSDIAQRLTVPRADARLLAKRIGQCLDGTAKR